MTNEILVAIVILIGVFHIVWYGASRTYQNSKIPDDQTVRDYLDAIMKRMKFYVDRTYFEESTIVANGYTLHLTVFATGKDAPTLVFIPGTTAYAQMYIQICYEVYKAGFNVIGFDPRGHGQSSGPRGDYTIDGIVDDTLAVVTYARNRFGGKIAVVGSSQGGIVAFYAAARDDAIAAAVCHNLADLNGKDNLVLSLIRPPRFLAPFAAFLMNLYRRYSFPVSLYLDLSKEKFVDGTDVATLIKSDPLAVPWLTFRALNSLMHTDLPKPVEKITVPVMLIHAETDNIFPQKYVEEIYNRLTCKKNYLLLKDTEHLVMTNNVDEVVPPIAAWLKEIVR
jgi:pimeloyl-ACP methyl ester carboxylesterase